MSLLETLNHNAKDPVVIAGCARTPIGAFQGALASLSAAELGACAIRAAVERAGLAATDIEEVIIGNVLSAGQGQAPARQAALAAGLPLSTHCTTLNKMCGSGLKAAMLAHDLIAAGSSGIMLAGGMESMTNAPYLLPRVREGLRMGHAGVIDHIFLDGLEDAYDKGKLMGHFAELCADKYTFSRAQQDEFAVTSLQRAIDATERKLFEREITEVTVATRNGTREVRADEQPFNANFDKIPQLRPAFKKDGSVTAANSSSISDGAAALVLMRMSTAEQRGLTPQAIIHGHATHAHEPAWFTTAPVSAIKKLQNKLNWKEADIDLYEINEAFAVVTMAAMKELNLPPDKVNIHGGACALGHPIGASGARILVTLLAALQRYGFRRGLASLCIGGGEAVAMAVEVV